jgi:hypothetical protein
MDATLLKLETLRQAYAQTDDVMSVAVLDSMIQLYIIGRIDVEFSDQGEPVAVAIDYTTPMVSAPMFADPASMPKRQIGFQVN